MLRERKEEGKVKEPRKKAAPKKKVTEGDATPELQIEKKPRARKIAAPKETADTASTVAKLTRTKKSQTTDTE